MLEKCHHNYIVINRNTKSLYHQRKCFFFCSPLGNKKCSSNFVIVIVVCYVKRICSCSSWSFTDDVVNQTNIVHILRTSKLDISFKWLWTQSIRWHSTIFEFLSKSCIINMNSALDGSIYFITWWQSRSSSDLVHLNWEKLKWHHAWMETWCVMVNNQVKVYI